MLGRCDDGDGVELEEAEAAHGLQHSARAPVEALRANGDPPGLLDRRPQAYRTSSRPSTRARRAAARSSLAVTFPRTPRLGVEASHVEHALRAVGLEVGAADDPVAGEQRQHVVAVRALVLALVDLDHVVEAEEPLEQRPVPEQVVEGAEEDGRRGLAVELGLGVDVERWAAVVGVHLAQETLVDERKDVVVEACTPALEPPVLADRRLGQCSPCAHGEERKGAQRLVLVRRSERRGSRAGSRARRGRSGAGTTGGPRRRARRCPTAPRAPSSPASSSTCSCRRRRPRSRASRAGLPRGSAPAPARRGPRARAARARGSASAACPPSLRRQCGQSSMGRRHASCAQYSKMRPEVSRPCSSCSEYVPMRLESVSRCARSTAEIESSCTALSRRIAASTSPACARRKRGAYSWVDTASRRIAVRLTVVVVIALYLAGSCRAPPPESIASCPCRARDAGIRGPRPARF